MSEEDWEYHESVHGICFDEGQSGNCGLECRGFLGGQCDIAGEIAETCKDYLLIKKFGELRLAVLRAQTKHEFNELRELDIIIEEDYGY